MDGSSADKDVIDLEDAARRIPGGIDGVKQMAPELIQECSQQLEAIRAALSAQDAGKVRLAAHTIKGSASVFSASRVTKAAFALEMIGRDADLDRAPSALEDLQAEVDLLEKVLTKDS